MENSQKPSVERFENAVLGKDYEAAFQALVDILGNIDSHFGHIEKIDFEYPPQLDALPQEKTVYFCTRMANIISELFSAPDLRLSKTGAIRLLSLQRWINLIFASSPYVNADHILQKYNTAPQGSETFDIERTESALCKFCILYLPESNLNINLDVIWHLDPELCASLCFALQSCRFIGTPAAFKKRNDILQWFPPKLAQLHSLSNIPASIAHDVYMHCSYDIAPNKHQVKKSLNQVIRRHLCDNGWQDRHLTDIGYKNGKPVMVVLLEHFHSFHSIYRTHSTSINAARNQFYIIGFGGKAVDAQAQTVFDEFHRIEGETLFARLNQIKEICEREKAAVFYMPSIGMDLLTIFASNTRLAPIQAVALGHPATTHSDFIEYVVVEDDYVGSEACFSEQLIRLPKDALPYVPSALVPTEVTYRLRENPEVVQIGIASTTMKLNPYFLEALKAIRDRAKVKVHFHFAVGQSQGITHPYVEKFIKSYLGDAATVHANRPYQAYLEILNNCDMMVNPLPFGNTNGIIDMVTLGLVGVCKTGAEVHEHIDQGLFARLGLPQWLVADTVDEYVESAIRLAENHQERLQLRRDIIEHNRLQTLFSGNPAPMGEELKVRLDTWLQMPNSPSNA